MRRVIAGRNKISTFEAVFDTRNISAGSSASNQLKLNISVNYFYPFVIHWGDGTSDYISTNTDSKLLHIYSVAGIYTVRIESHRKFSMRFINTNDRLKILEVKRWGLYIFISQDFYGCANLSLTNVIGIPLVESLFNSFIGCTSLTTVANMGSWDVRLSTNMSSVFNGCSNFNQNIGGWNVGNVTTMSSMFEGNTKFNQNIGGWNVGNVTDMSNMFRGCSLFNQNIGAWNVANVTTMFSMFWQATNFNQNIGGWNVSKVTDFGFFTRQATNFNTDVSGWNVSNVTNMNNMFSLNSFNQNIGGWNVGNVTTMSSMFEGNTKFNQNIGGWNVSNVTTMNWMFYGATNFNQNIGDWDVSKVTVFANFMFGKTPATFSSTNLDSILIGWSGLAVKPNQTPHFGTAKRTSASNTAYSLLTSAPNNWVITHGGII